MRLSLILAALACIALAGCSAGREVERSVMATGYDFTPYTSKGFFISPEQYLLPYDPMGVVRISFFPEVKKYESEPNHDPSKYTLVRQAFSNQRWLVENIDVRTVIDEAYRLASKMGADAIVRFTIDMKPMSNGVISYPSYEVSGFAIKRK